MAQPYPISRESRDEAIFFGDGSTVYGPFALKIFDIDDVEVWTKATGGIWTIAAPTVAKVDPSAAFDEFTITFASAIPSTTKVKVLSARVHERSAGVTAGTKLSPDALERELTKQGTILQELRRDVDLSVRGDPGVPGLRISDALADGQVLMKSGDRLVPGPTAAQITAAEGHAEAAEEHAGAASASAASALSSLTQAVAAAAAALAAVNAGYLFDTDQDFRGAHIPVVLAFVDTAGYDAPFDGGGHRLRRIAAPSVPAPWQKPSADGAWWEIAEPVVNFQMLGADPTGATLADQQIKDTFDCAAAIGASVENHSGRYLWRHQKIEILVEADLTGTTIVLDELSGAIPSTWAIEIAFQVKNNVAKFDLDAAELAELNATYRPSMVPGLQILQHPVLRNYRDAYVQFWTETEDIKRNDGTNRMVFDHVITGADGMLTVGLDMDFTSAPITKCTVYPRETTVRTFKSPKFEAHQCGSVCLIDVIRSNTDVYNFEFIETVPLTTYMARALVQERDCIRVNWHRGTAEGQRQGAAAYTKSGARSIFVQCHDFYAVDGWGTTGLNETKYHTWHDCVLSRIDVHWGARRFNAAYRCNMKQGASTIGGSGIFLMEDCEYLIGTPASTADNATGHMLSPRGDYGWEFRGEFQVVRPRIIIASDITEATFPRPTIVRPGGLLSYDPGRDVYLPNVVVRDPVIIGASTHGLGTNGLIIAACNLRDIRCVSGGRKMYYPDRIDISGGEYVGFSTSARVTISVTGDQYGHDSVRSRRSRILPKDTNAEILMTNVPALIPDRVAPRGTNSPHHLDFKMAQSNWSADYIADVADIWVPKCVLVGCTKTSIFGALKAQIIISACETVHISDDFGGRALPTVIMNGGVLRPYVDGAATETEWVQADLYMTGVGFYAPRKPSDNSLGTVTLNNAKGAGNIMIDGVKTTNVYGWDAAYTSFWAI